MKEQYQVSVSPHVRDSITTSKLMLYVILALIPASCAGVLNFGLHALWVLLVSVVAAVAAEFVFEALTDRRITIMDGSAVVTGLLIGLNMPSQIQLWIPILGSVFAIVVIKQLYGGIGRNFMNPALGARCFLMISFSIQMTNYSANGFSQMADAVSGATPLAVLRTGAHYDLTALFIGNVRGVIGETSTLAILVGAAFLVLMQVIEVRIPLTYLGTFAVLTFVTAMVRGYDGACMFTLEELCAGGLMLGAWFMATDYVTSPITVKGKWVYGFLLGLLTWIFRMVGKNSEGVSYAIIFCNCLVPMIEHYTMPRVLGMKRKKEKEAVR